MIHNDRPGNQGVLQLFNVSGKWVQYNHSPSIFKESERKALLPEHRSRDCEWRAQNFKCTTRYIYFGKSIDARVHIFICTHWMLIT